jgi:hypothetical protein
MKKKQKLVEMASAVRFGQFEIQVYNDHAPMHFHLIKKDCYEARINVKTLELLDYKWKKNKCEMTQTDREYMEAVLKQKYKKGQNYRQRIIELWNDLNTESPYITLTKYETIYKKKKGM